ncbi:MAG TPA: tetratricopeptide repeat protein [Polyangia bacterium]
MIDGGDDDDRGDWAARRQEEAAALRERGAYPAAAEACDEAVRIFEELEGSDSPNLANALIERGRILDLMDRQAEAEAALERGVEILRPLISSGPASGEAAGADALPPEVLDDLTRLTLRAEVALADVIRKRGRLAEATARAEAVVRWADTVLPAGDLLIAEALNGLGVIYKFQGRFADAEAAYQRALRIVEVDGSVPDPLATLMHNLGGLAHSRGDFAAGEPLARRAVELRESLYGRRHPSVAADIEAWGALLEGLGRLPEAEQAYAEALATFESTLGPDSLEAASSASALASVHQSLGRRQEALAGYERALAIREAKLAPQHFDLALTLNNLGMLLQELDRVADARTAIARALAIFEASLGPDHPHSRAAATNLAALRRPRSRAAPTRGGGPER